jgi:hypothetical protein
LTAILAMMQKTSKYSILSNNDDDALFWMIILIIQEVTLSASGTPLENIKQPYNVLTSIPVNFSTY